MQKEVRITPTAKVDLERITEYLIEEWNTKIASDFLIRFDEVCNLISLSPQIFPYAIHRKSVRKAVVTFQNTIYFKEYSEYIDILVIFDTRQSLRKLRNVLK